MRKSPYLSHYPVQFELPSTRNRDSNDFLYQTTYKQEPTKLYNSIGPIVLTPPKSNTQFLYQHSKINQKRPLTVNKTHSDLKNKSTYVSIQGEEKSYLQPNKELWVSSAREPRQVGVSREPDQSKGRIYRGSSWKFEDRSKMQVKELRDTSRYSHNTRMTNNLTPGPKDQRNTARQSYRSSGVNVISQLLEKNLKDKTEQPRNFQENEDFFQYVMRFSYRTKKGSIPSNPNKVNQDSYMITPNIQNKTYQHFFGICDGHGPLGHYVSGFIKNTLPAIVTNAKTLQKSPVESLMKAFEMSYQKLVKQSNIDLTFSGSTIISAYFFKNKLYTCNVGDSRAIVGRFKQNEKKWSAMALSQDHKPSLPKEAERIRKMNGRIESYKDEFGQEIGPLRVWVKNENVPGLAMTRSFGDLIGASVGVSPVPEIKQFNLSEQDRIIVIASDGVFQFLENSKIIQELYPFYQNKQIQQASDHLLSLAHRSWNQNSSIVDDISFILIFLTYNQV